MKLWLDRAGQWSPLAADFWTRLRPEESEQNEPPEKSLLHQEMQECKIVFRLLFTIFRKKCSELSGSVAQIFF